MKTLAPLLLTCLFIVPAYAQYSGGTGEPDDPYQIATAADLIALGETPEDYDKHFLLTADIDLDPNLPGGKVFERAVIASPGVDWTDFWSAFRETAFTGFFNGGGHTISHLTIRGKDRLGLFGQLDSSASISNLGLEAVKIIGTSYVGALVGYSNGSIAASYSTGSVTGNSDVGGLVGDNGMGRITSSYSTASVCKTGWWGAGGLVGVNTGTVIECYSVGKVTGESLSVGGLIGSGGAPWPGAEGFVATSFWDIETSGQTESGGGTGKTTAEMQMPSTFMGWGACGSQWTIDEGVTYPHLAWENVPGEVIARPTYGGGTGTVDDPYLIWTAEQLNTIGLIAGDLDKHFKLMADIDLSGFDGKNDRPAFNIIGSGWAVTLVPPELRFVGIPFTGSLDGNGHTISHLTILGLDYVGLLGQLGSTASVSNLGLKAVEVIGTGWFVGGLAGANGGTVSNCYSTGLVGGTGSYVGGLVGENGGSITSCYSSASIIADWSVGGLVGLNSWAGSVTNCYSSGSVSAYSIVGGLVGGNEGSITVSYSSGSVSGTYNVGGLVGCTYYDYGSVTASFWDTQTSGQTTSAGGTGQTTAEMQTASTFLEAGWDFVGETANGTEDIWWILEGQDYPRLWWELGENEEPNP